MYIVKCLYLPAYSPELNLIEIVWKQAKYHWRRFITWTQDTMEYELNTLLEGYSDQFAINFS
ncbi:transposase [Xenorhabdus sp. PB62.4]|uniref:transposase n=1 Tax=Xenorhabdus sp. PB62.4 TaxID=1851573 RepID=UPI002103FC26|nr:transposase [Xenorhabdus sp. PB62.4]